MYVQKSWQTFIFISLFTMSPVKVLQTFYRIACNAVSLHFNFIKYWYFYFPMALEYVNSYNIWNMFVFWQYYLAESEETYGRCHFMGTYID